MLHRSSVELKENGTDGSSRSKYCPTQSNLFRMEEGVVDGFVRKIYNFRKCIFFLNAKEVFYALGFHLWQVEKQSHISCSAMCFSDGNRFYVSLFS